MCSKDDNSELKVCVQDILIPAGGRWKIEIFENRAANDI